MTFNAFNDPIEGALFVLIIVCTPIVILVTTLRVISSLRNHKSLYAEDYLAVLASLLNLAYNALEMWSKLLIHRNMQCGPGGNISNTSCHSHISDERRACIVHRQVAVSNPC